MILCEYCKEKEASFQLGNGKWCCEKRVQQCPGVKKKTRKTRLEQSIYSNLAVMNKVAASGMFKCRYCDRPGIYYKGYIKNEHRFQCVELAPQCPGYHKYLSNIHKKKFEEKPDLKIQLKHTMKKVQNRPEVKSKKSETMTLLHNGDCEPCKEFQQKFHDGQKNRRTDKYEYWKKYRKEN